MKEFVYLKRVRTCVMTVLLLLTLTVATSCTASQTQMLEGILQNVDAINGKITVVTKDGRVMTINIDQGTAVQTQSGNSSLEALDSGASVSIEVDDSNNAHLIAAQLARVEGIITGVSNNQVTIIPERSGSAVTITISGTRIVLKDGRVGTLSDLKAGIKVEAKYNPQTLVALKVYIDSQETAEVEGKITAVSASSLTLQTDSGRTLTLSIGNTQILLEEDKPGIPSDLKVGARIEVKFDPTKQSATRIKVKIADSSSSSGGDSSNSGGDSSSSTEGPKVEGTIASLAGDTIVVNAEKGGQVVIEIANTTRIERDENTSALRSDLKVGVRIEAYYNSATRVASKITIKSQSSS